MKNLYVNGCSFSSGNNLPIEETWGYKLADKLNLKLYAEATNSQSMKGICFSSTLHLLDLDPKDTLVVIGTTWHDRRHILVDDSITSLTPSDIEGITEPNKLLQKYSTSRKLTSPYYNTTDNQEKLARLSSQLHKNNDAHFKAYNQKRLSIIESLKDSKYDLHRASEYLYDIINLQNYLKVNKYRYEIVFFQKNYNLEGEIVDKLRDKLDYTCISNIDVNSDYPFNKTPLFESHPSSVHCTQLAEILYNKFNNE